MTAQINPRFLRTLEFLAPATDEDLALLMPAAQVEEYPAGSSIFHEGDHLSHIFILTSGTVSLEINDGNRRPRRIQTIGPGELLGWSPLLGTGAMTADAHAITPVRFVALDAKTILAVCEKDPRFGARFMKLTAAAIAARLNATRLQLLDVYPTNIPVSPLGGRL